MQELRQQVKLTQQLTMTPQLQQSIKLLQLSQMELIETVREELEQNPVLEFDNLEEVNSKEVQKQESPEEKGDMIKEIPDDYLTQYAHDSYSAYSHRVSTRRSTSDDDDESGNIEAFVAQKATLCEHLLWQLQMTEASERERELISELVYNLDDDGYLRIPLDEISLRVGADITELERLLGDLQTFDPAGVGARNLQECLLIQAKALDMEDALVGRIIRECLHNLESNNLQNIAKKLGASISEVVSAHKIILAMEPKPGRPFSGSSAQYITPDVYLYKVGEEYRVVLNEDGIPSLSISDLYRNMLQNSKQNSGGAKEYLQEKIREANWLIKSIERRKETIIKVMESILNFQRDFFDHGVSHLKPMVLRDVAEDIGMHESTISRVTTNKYVYTPQGLFELKYFFSSGINSTSGGDNIASESVKEKIKSIIKSEDSKKPFSDQEIVIRLREENIEIARRTVAKYREMMGILPSSKRKRLF